VITNAAAGLSTEQLSHADVLATGARSAAQLATVIEAILPQLT
jgi:purine nucleoside phosphorylase